LSLQHIVPFNLSEELPPEDKGEMRRQVEARPAAIGGMTSVGLGRWTNEERTRGYQYLLYIEFLDVEALVAYHQKDPVHQHFLRWVLDPDCTPLAFDYPLDETTVILEGPACIGG